MTEGTSQGLFVVVAIVIFGIFVGLSYTIFGDTLKPSVVDLFTNATEQSTADLNKENVKLVDNYEDTLFTYTFNDTSKTSTITGFVAGKEVTELEIPNSIIKDGVVYSVTTIGKDAFKDKLLTSVSIPNSVTKIGICAFQSNSLTILDIGNSVSTIGLQAFAYNDLTKVKIGNSVTTIGTRAFGDNILTSIEIPDSVTTIDDFAFYNNFLTSVVIPDSVTTIGTAAFYNNKLSNVDFGDSLTSIGSNAFNNNLLTSVVIPDSVKTVSTQAFTKNTTLKDVELPFGFEITPDTYQEGATITNRTK